MKWLYPWGELSTPDREMKPIFQGTDPLGDGVFFLLGAEVGGEQVAGGAGAGVLGEVDQIDGRAPLFVEFGDFFLELGGGVFEFERDRALVGLDRGGGCAQSSQRKNF